MKTVVITGGSRGIGKGLCHAFAKDGYNVLINYNKSQNEAKKLMDELLSEGCLVDVFGADVRKTSDTLDMMNYAADKFGGIDILINNAGISAQKLFCDMSEEEWGNMSATNIDGVLNCTRGALPFMINKKAGSIINISSIWGIVGASCEVHYSTTKAAIIGFTRALAKEVAPCGIRVNCIAPGIIETDMLDGFDEGEIDEMICETPLMRLGKPSDVAAAALYLAKADFVTGQIISPNGGIVI